METAKAISKFVSRRKTTGRQGVHREEGAEGIEEKHRAVNDEATRRINRSAKEGARSSLDYVGEGALIHPTNQGVCGWHGEEDECESPGGHIGIPSGIGISKPISASEMVSEVL